MKNKFQEYHPLDKRTITEIWHNADFIFDTNILLNLYRYSDKTSEKFIQIIMDLGDRIWIPFQVGLEFYKNRLSVISEEQKNYSEFHKRIDELIDKIENKNRNPFFSKSLTERFINLKNDLKIEVENKVNSYKLRSTQDTILESINTAFENKVGTPQNDNELEKYKKEAEKRYKSKIPPGYKDAGKPENEKYGDFIIWKEIINKSKETKKDIIFILDDRKEDWWLEHQGKTISPRPELLKEFRIETNKIIHFYKPFQFLEFANDYLESQISKEVIEEVKNYQTNVIEKEYIQLNYIICGELNNFNLFIKEIKNSGYNILYESDIENKVHYLNVTIPNIPDLKRRLDSKFIAKLTDYDLELSEKNKEG